VALSNLAGQDGDCPAVQVGVVVRKGAEVVGKVDEMKRAAIYIRVSSEHQGAKASPDEQEQDCRALAAEQGLEVVSVYRDIERYRAKKRMVDPSGTRVDRPGLVAMLQDAQAGYFDVILSWREDRLYRGLKAMLLVLEIIQEHKISIILARENFDEKMAPLKAWLAQMELDGMKERMTMGVKARLRRGDANTGQDRYGYRREGEIIVIVEEEARWVRKIFEWYLSGMPKMEMRRRLVEAGAPQKGSSIPRKVQWSRAIIDGILMGAEDYCMGIKRQSRAGEVFEISIPPILDPQIYQRFLQVRKENKTYPAHNKKHNYLIGGMVYCACNRKWGARVASYTRRNRRGELVERKSYYWVYYCPEQHADMRSPDCGKSIGAIKADKIVWDKVREAVSNPDILMGKAQFHVAKLREQSDSMQADRDRLQDELDALTMERQQIITWGRKKVITQEDLEYQLAALTLQELGLKRELAAYIEATNLHELDNWEEAIREYFLDLQAGMGSLEVEPQNEEEAAEIFRLKKGIIKALVNRVTIDRNKELSVEIQVDVLAILRDAGQNFNAIQQAETYTHTPISRAHPHPGAGGG
jgi:site-specific DNA recombinase